MFNINRTLIVFILLAVFALLFLRQCNETDKLNRELASIKAKSQQDYNNLLASKDTIKQYKNDNGALIAEKRAFTYDIEEYGNKLDWANGEYAKELGLNKSLKETNSLLKAKLSVKDTIYVNNPNGILLSDGTKLFKFNDFKDFGKGNTRNFNGSVKIAIENNDIKLKSSEYDIEQSIKLYAAIEEKDGHKEVKMSTSYPGIKFDTIENINLINNKLNEKPIKKARWSIGFGVGYGMTLINGQMIQYGPNINAGLYWSPSFLQF